MIFEESLRYLEDFATKVTIVRHEDTKRWKCIAEYKQDDRVAAKGHRPEDTYITLQGAVVETQRQLQATLLRNKIDRS